MFILLNFIRSLHLPHILNCVPAFAPALTKMAILANSDVASSGSTFQESADSYLNDSINAEDTGDDDQNTNSDESHLITSLHYKPLDR